MEDNNTITIREMEERDLDEMFKLHTTIFPIKYSSSYIKKFIELLV